jgi:hypothetical protein
VRLATPNVGNSTWQREVLNCGRRKYVFCRTACHDRCFCNAPLSARRTLASSSQGER